MTDLRDVKCLTVKMVRELLGSRDFDSDHWPNLTEAESEQALLSYLVAVAALRICYVNTCDPGIVADTPENLHIEFCEHSGLTLEQATDLGIFEDAT